MDKTPGRWSSAGKVVVVVVLGVLVVVVVVAQVVVVVVVGVVVVLKVKSCRLQLVVNWSTKEPERVLFYLLKTWGPETGPRDSLVRVFPRRSERCEKGPLLHIRMPCVTEEITVSNVR